MRARGPRHHVDVGSVPCANPRPLVSFSESYQVISGALNRFPIFSIGISVDPVLLECVMRFFPGAAASHWLVVSWSHWAVSNSSEETVNQRSCMCVSAPLQSQSIQRS